MNFLEKQTNKTHEKLIGRPHHTNPLNSGVSRYDFLMHFPKIVTSPISHSSYFLEGALASCQCLLWFWLINFWVLSVRGAKWIGRLLHFSIIKKRLLLKILIFLFYFLEKKKKRTLIIWHKNYMYLQNINVVQWEVGIYNLHSQLIRVEFVILPLKTCSDE